MHTWQLQKAKAHLSELIRCAAEEGPQEITSRGIPTAVVISKEEYEKLTNPYPSLDVFLRNSPLFGIDLSLTRGNFSTREIDL